MYFQCSMLSQNSCKEYLNVATLKMPVLYQIITQHFDVRNALLCHIYGNYRLMNDPAFLAHFVLHITWNSLKDATSKSQHTGYSL